MSFKSLMRKFRSLEPEDFRVLLAIESGMARFEFVPLDTLIAYAKLPRDEVMYRLGRAMQAALVRRISVPYKGFSLNYAGYDFLALNAFVKADAIEAIGSSLGLGKEADVYEALTPLGKMVAVKFHRLGRISFRQTLRARGYVDHKTLWLFRSKAAAEKEYEAMQKAYAEGVSVPKPLAQNRHAVLMGKIEGAELAQCKKLPSPMETLQAILRSVSTAYRKAGIVHADLSEYNILAGSEGSMQIIDWPQYVTLNHPNAENLLRRDVENILKYFRRAFRVDMPLERALNFVKKGGRLKV